MIDVIRLAATTHGVSGSVPNDGNSYDGDVDTYTEISGSGDNAGGSGYITHTFDAVKNIKQIKYRLRTNSWSQSGASSNTSGAQVQIETSVNGVDWVKLTGSDAYNTSCVGDCNSTQDSGVITVNGDWNIKAIRISLAWQADKECNPACGGDQGAGARAYDLQALMPAGDFGVII